MDGINSVPSGGIPVQVGGWTYLDISHTLQVSDEPVNQDELVVFNPSPEQRRQSWAPYFSTTALARNPAMSGVYQEISGKTDAAIQAYYDGNLPEDALSETFQTLYKQFSEACTKNGYPLPLPGTDRYIEQRKMDAFYSEFCRKLLETAVSRNTEEGRRYVTGALDGRQSWKYYNSDYYYQSEAGISAITRGIQSIAEERGYEDFSIRDYQAEGLNLYHNFNTAFPWRSSICLTRTRRRPGIFSGSSRPEPTRTSATVPSR